jgi:Bacterial Ig-like domain (group 3)
MSHKAKSLGTAKRAEIRRMNVRLSVGAVGNKEQGMRTIGWCMVFVGMVAATSCPRSAAENTAETRTTLTVATDDAGPRTRATLTAHVATPDLAGTPSGVVNFRAEQTDQHPDLGSAFLDGEGNASLQTGSLSAGNHQVIAIYKGQTGYLSSTSELQTVHANVSTVAGFSVAATPTSLSAAVGSFVSSVVTVTPVNGFNAYVNLSCKGLPLNSTCTFTPVSVPASCTTSASGVETCVPGSSVMQIQTLAPSPPTTAQNAGGSGMLRYAFVFPALLGLAGIGASRRRRNLALGLLAFAGVMTMTACSQRYRYLNHGPPDNIGTPLGSYTVTIDSQSSTGSETTTPPTNPQITLTITAATT